ncbi:hypothetical protein [Olivibacter sitiensis]|uniref:hypothetical protein n=1 Tax=Olivibacter sitiensis TaxID=376470 RepID=UPI0004046807|nr:hypothetical protein [Olivibacter sitiensis]
MKNIFATFLAISLFLLVSCSKKDDAQQPELPTETTPFTEGTIKMGMYSHGVDLGYFIERLDFSKDDVHEQFLALAQGAGDGQNMMALLQEVGQTNPFVALSLMLNANICTYYIKDNVVLGKATGFGYELDNYHDKGNDEGKVFLRTLVNSPDIAEEDRELSFSYVPSTDLGVGSGGTVDHTLYDRQTETNKETVAGYVCDVSTYTLKSAYISETDPNNPLPQSPQLYKLVTYTSSLFNNTINFTHPFYLPEDHGILQLEIYYEDSAEPTLVMKPTEIIQRPIAQTEMQITVKDPVYTFNDAEVAWKALAILFSGWGALNIDN